MLDGSTLESVLEKLQDYVEKHLNLNQLFPGFAKLEDIIGAGSIQDLGQASFANLDKFLKARLATFLDKKLGSQHRRHQQDSQKLSSASCKRQSRFMRRR